MTHNVQTSISTRKRLFSRSYFMNLYQAVINTEDGDSFEYEVEAESFTAAAEKAEQYAFSLGMDITYIELYHVA